MSVDEPAIRDLIDAARAARENAYAPYSGFKVGAVVLSASGKVYSGCNVENASYGLTICAERVAIAKAVSEGETTILAVAIVAGEHNPASPCGACLQVMAEFAPDAEPLTIITSSSDGAVKVRELSDYLPDPFTLR